jgi:hypothetical protein
MDDYRSGGVSKYRFPVLNELHRLGIPVVDVDQAVRAAGDPLPFFPLRDDWGHFNARGYRLMARQIMARLDRDFPPPGEKLAQASTPVSQGAPQARVITAQADRPSQARADYDNFGATSAVIPVNTGNITRSSGAGVLGLTAKPTRLNSRFHGHVVMNALSTENNEFVVAVFRGEADSPVAVMKRPVRAGERVTIDETFEVKAGRSDQLNFEVRVGLAQPGGEIYVNGDSRGRDMSLPIPFIEVREAE